MTKPEDIKISVSMEMLRSRVPEEVVRCEAARRGIIGDYPEITDYMLAVQEWFNNCVGLDELVSQFIEKGDKDV